MIKLIRHLKDVVQGKARIGAKRSPLWRKVRAVHLKLNPSCAVCSGVKKLEVHHKIPFTISPELELTPSNLITLCESKKGGMSCHQAMGHLGSYRSWNDEVVKDAQYFRVKILNRPHRKQKDHS